MSILEVFRTGGVKPGRVAAVGFIAGKLAGSLALVWIGTYLLSWHFARGMGLFFICCAACAAYNKQTR